MSSTGLLLATWHDIVCAMPPNRMLTGLDRVLLPPAHVSLYTKPFTRLSLGQRTVIMPNASTGETLGSL